MEKSFPPSSPKAQTRPESGDATQPQNPPAAEAQQTEAYTGQEATQADSVAKDAGQEVAQEQANPAASVRAKLTSNVLGDFRLLQKLGKGGMGAVYKAQQISLEREVALKLLSRELASKPLFVQRFYREARLLAKLDHPNIVRGYAVGEEHGYHYCAMEFIDGGSLTSLLQRTGKLSVGDALHVAITCAEALQYAHEHNMVHRDIKPDNILVTQSGVLKVADLGLAKAMDEELALTHTGTGAGTPFYMAPEQTRDAKRVDGRCDIYSLGCMLYQLLTGTVPYKGDTHIAVLTAKEEGKHVPARRLNPHVPEHLDLIIDKALAKRPEHRYQTCADLLKDLQGLGLANDSLTCLSPAAAEDAAGGRSRQGKARKRKLDIPQGPTVVGAGSSPPARTMSPASADQAVAQSVAQPAGDYWHVSYRSPEGRNLRRKLTTAQVLAMIREKDFDVTAQASRTAEGEFRSLGTYREFEPALRIRLTTVKAERKAKKFRRFYEKIEQEEISRQRWRWLGNLFRTAVSWLAMLVILAIAAGVCYGLYLVVPIFFKWLTAKLGLSS